VNEDEPTNNELWAELAKAERQRDSVTEDLKEVLRLVLHIKGCICACGKYATMVLVREHMGICDECSKRRNLMGVVELIHHTPAMRRIAQIAKETLP
jgi:hypothetical protein